MLSFSAWTPWSVVVRVLVSLLLGAVIGLDRGAKGRVAGIKTNAVVCLGATLVMLTSQYMQVYFPGTFDLARLGAQVISGVGFLGVGTIVISGRRVTGLTTAASLWTCACIGLAVGIGFIEGSLLITLCLLVVFNVFPKIEEYANRKSPYVSVYLELEDPKCITDLSGQLKQKHITMEGVDILTEKGKNHPMSVRMSLHLPYPAREFQLATLLEMDGVLSAVLM